MTTMSEMMSELRKSAAENGHKLHFRRHGSAAIGRCYRCDGETLVMRMAPDGKIAVLAEDQLRGPCGWMNVRD